MDIPGYKLDVNKAKALMEEAGYKNGFSVKLIAQDAMTKKMSEVFADNLSKIGITVTIEMLESNTAVQKFMSGDYEIGVLGLNNAQMDLDFVKILFQPNGSLNLAKYDNKDLYDKFLAAAQISDSTKRLELYKEINGILLTEAVYVPIFFPNRAHAMNAKFSIAYIGGSSIAEIRNMRWD
jgi:peptide/nickel transport system substrate-binding protein